MATFYGDPIVLPEIQVVGRKLPGVQYVLEASDIILRWNPSTATYVMEKVPGQNTTITITVPPRTPADTTAPTPPPATITDIEAVGEMQMLGGLPAQTYTYTFSDGSTQSFTIYMKVVSGNATYYYYKPGTGWRKTTDPMSGTWGPSSTPLPLPPIGGGGTGGPQW